MQNETRIVFNSSGENIVIENKLAHFQNSLFNKNYLTPDRNYAITPRQIYIDLNFKNPICPVNNAFPSFICVPYNHLIKKIEDSGISIFKLKYFSNIHKYYLNTAKKYSISDLFDEWSSKELIGIKTKKSTTKGRLGYIKKKTLL